MCTHAADGFVHTACFRGFAFLTEPVKCPICRKLLPLKDLLLLACSDYEEQLMKSLLEEDESTFVRAIEVAKRLDSVDPEYWIGILRMAFVVSVSFGFFEAAKRFHQQIFLRPSFFKRAAEKLGIRSRKEVRFSGNFWTHVLELALNLKFGRYSSFDFNGILSTALFCAVYDRNVEMVKYVLSLKDVNVNCRDTDLCSPIYFSIIKDSLEITRLLLDHGARTAVNRKASAFQVATYFNREEHYQLLCSYPYQDRS